MGYVIKGKQFGPPPLELSVSSGGATLFYLPPGNIDAQIAVDDAVVDFNQARCEAVRACNSDRPSRIVMPTDSMSFYPAGTQLYLNLKNPLPGLIMSVNAETLANWIEPLNVDATCETFHEYRQDFAAGRFAQAAIEEISNCYHFSSAVDTLTLEALLLGFSARLFCHFKTIATTNTNGRGSITDRKRDLTDEKLKKACDFIRDNVSDQELKVARVADAIGWSPPHFADVFRSRLGKSPYKFILSERVNYAKQLLTSTNSSLSEVAYMSGFSNQAHMTTTFSKVLSCTPAKIRADC
ncbi:helix-turn-helix domain-containing protein [Gymnodinialimonas hymeniacidonis]|uniref:helix-turn-helix domain-containing protein n=1 Tax=Gymnodinialimonas hymeniacidonis TaxID=3126508 RepID=UPI0034C650BA